MRILWITNWLPYPPATGYTIRVYNLMKRAALRHQIDLVSYVRASDGADAVAHLKSMCANVIIIPDDEGRLPKNLWQFIKGKLQAVFCPWKTYVNPEMSQVIKGLTSQKEYDFIQIEDSFMAETIVNVSPRFHPKKLLSFIDIDFIRYQRMVKITPDIKRKIKYGLRSLAMRRWEPYYAAHFDLLFAMSIRDKEILHKITPELNVEILPNGVDTQILGLLPQENPTSNIIFVGNMAYYPNEDAMLYFIEDILPLVREQIPAQLFVVGGNATENMLGFNGIGIHVTGYVEDVKPFYEMGQVFVVPLRAGGGTRLKILEAMSLGRAVVSTTIGCEGIDAEDGKNILIADDARVFAEKVVQLIRNDELRRDVVKNGRQLVVEKYDWDSIAQKYLDLLDQAAGKT